MRFIEKLFKIISLSAVLLGVSFAPSISQEAAKSSGKIATYQENFESDDINLMLGGQINFRNSKSKWLVYINSGKLVMENRLEPQSLQYDDIQWVRYPNSEVLSATGDATISVTVEAGNDGRGGVGILVGSGERGAYWMFGVDAEGRYHVVNRGSRNASPAYSAKHDAVSIGKPNRVSFERRGDNIAFFVNGTELIQVPNGNQQRNSRRQNGQAGVGLAAFGLGTYTFDDVEITQGN